MSCRILIGDVRERLRELPDESVHMCCTSPPYWGLRNYGVPGQLGLEATPEEHVRVMVEVFRDVRRVMRSDGVLFLNYGDAYQEKQLLGMPWRLAFALQADGWWLRSEIIWAKPNPMPESVWDRPTKSHEHLFLLAKSKRYYYDYNAVRQPIADGTVERSRYSHQYATRAHRNGGTPQSGGTRPDAIEEPPAGRNLRDVWTIPTEPFPGAHFATFPQALVVPCIKAGTSEHGCCSKCGAPWERVVERGPGLTADQLGIDGTESYKPEEFPQSGGQGGAARKSRLSGKIQAEHKRDNPDRFLGWSPGCDCAAAVVPCTVLDPFGGAGTVGLVADRLGRDSVLIELNPGYAEMARKRIRDDAPLFADVIVA